MNSILIITFGFVFGLILQYAKLNRYDTISGMAMLKDLTVAKAIALTIGLGAIILNTEIAFGLASYHIKPIMLTGIISGGLIFGAGMAILGYCPGTLPISLGQGSFDALFGIIGGFIAALLYTFTADSIPPLLGPNLGKISLDTIFEGNRTVFFIVLLLFGSGLIALTFWMNKLEKSKDYKWLVSGIALAFFVSIIFLTSTFDKVMGASSMYPYVSNILINNTEHPYFIKISKSGSWEFLYLIGAFLSGLIVSLYKKEFKFVLIHQNWKNFKNNSSSSRIIWSLIGGFLIIFGSRLSTGCTSGHVISGGMQIAISSFIFAAFVFAGLLITGRFFYKK